MAAALTLIASMLAPITPHTPTATATQPPWGTVTAPPAAHHDDAGPSLVWAAATAPPDLVAADAGTSTENSAPEQPAPPPPDPPPVTHREAVLAELEARGAARWIIDGLDCIGWHESRWQNVRSHARNSDGTFDHGVLQINDVNVRRLSIDPYTVAGTVTAALTLIAGRSRAGQYPFADWVASRFCR